MRMLSRVNNFIICLIALIGIIALQAIPGVPAQAAGATSNVHIIKYAADGTTVLAEKTVSYEWMQKMLPVQGDGKTHYYHQGPIFEGDIWDPGKTLNLKDKGAIKGTSFKDLCDLVGGMSPGDEASAVAVDGWHTEFAYGNVYQPVPQQGVITLCWYNAEDTPGSETSGTGYPGNNAYNTAIQMVFMATTANADGKHVFGNSDMKVAFPEEKYQHFYDGQYPSTNGLSGKWIAEIRIYSGGIPPGLKINYSTANYPQDDSSSSSGTPRPVPWISIVLGLAGLLSSALVIFVIAKLRRINLKIGFILLLSVVLIASAITTGIQTRQGSSSRTIEKTWELTLSGNGQQKTLNMKDIRSLPSYNGIGGFFTTVGVVNGPFKVKGILLTELCDTIGGVTPSDMVMVSASDGYSTVFDYEQLMGNFVIYDVKTLKEIPSGEVKIVLMYELDGKDLSQDGGQPLRIAIAGSNPFLTEGNNWVRWVNKIEILKSEKAAK
jgi:hypothetical protein